jgi:hypothetical protein
MPWPGYLGEGGLVDGGVWLSVVDPSGQSPQAAVAARTGLVPDKFAPDGVSVISSQASL